MEHRQSWKKKEAAKNQSTYEKIKEERQLEMEDDENDDDFLKGSAHFQLQREKMASRKAKK
jgi:hypothetical protein